MSSSDDRDAANIPRWLAARLDAAVPDGVNYLGCVCVDEHRRFSLVEPAGHYRGVTATFPKVARRPGERPSEALARCVTDKLAATLQYVYPVPGVWEGNGVRAAFFAGLHTFGASPVSKPPSSHVAAVHTCEADEAIRRFTASGHAEDRARDLALLALVRATSLSPARRLLLMVRELHRMGFEGLRPSCGMSPSGMYWRFDLWTEFHVARLEGRSRGDSFRGDYTTGTGQRIFDVEDACFEGPGALARRLLRRAPWIVYEGLGSDPDYVRWYAAMLAATDPEGLFVEYADDDFTGKGPYLSLANVPEATTPVPLPPPRPGTETPTQVHLEPRDDGLWFGRLDATRRDARRWLVRVTALGALPGAFEDLPSLVKLASWSEITESVARADPPPLKPARSPLPPRGGDGGRRGSKSITPRVGPP